MIIIPFPPSLFPFHRKSFQETGNTEDSVWSAGMVMGLIDDVPTCQELIEGMVEEAEGVISNRLTGLIGKE